MSKRFTWSAPPVKQREHPYRLEKSPEMSILKGRGHATDRETARSAGPERFDIT